MMARAWRWLMRATLALVVGAVFVTWLAPSTVLPPLARYLDVSDAPRKVDYVLVLNGDPETRPFAAAALVKAGLAQTVLLTPQRLALESSSVREGSMPSELQILKAILRARGVGESAIEVLPAEITNTADEANALAAFLDTQPMATVAVVTNTYHTRRARRTFARRLGDAAERVSFLGVPADDATQDDWWRTARGCTTYLTEYGKSLYYLWRH